MTVIVAAYDKNKNVIMGADRQSTVGNSIMLLANPKIIKKGAFLIGVAGWHLLSKVIQYDFVIPKHRKDLKADVYINTVFIKELRKCLKENNVSKVEHNKENTQSCMLISYKGNIYNIYSDFSVSRNNDYCAIGSGSNYALGSLASYKKIKKCIDKEGVKIAVASAIKNDIYCSGKIDIFIG